MPCLTVLAPPCPGSDRVGKAFWATHGSNRGWFLVSGSKGAGSWALPFGLEMLLGLLCSRADWDGDYRLERPEHGCIAPDDQVVDVAGSGGCHRDDECIAYFGS
jgi:hypothetical protein